MAVLPGFEEILVVLVLLVPGFFSFLLAKRFAAVGKKFTDFEKAILSVMLTLVVYIPFTFITGFKSLEEIRNGLVDPFNLLILIAISGGVGLGVGLVFKMIFNRDIVLGDAWDVSFDLCAKKGGSWVTVYTKTNQEYRGIVKLVGRAEDGSKEIVITQPIQIFRKDDGTSDTEMNVGEDMLFTEKDIGRISFFTNITKDKD